MKRGFMANKSGKKNEGGLGGSPMDHSLLNDGDSRLGSVSGVPEVGKTSGLSWAPVTDSLRDRWRFPSATTPWKTTPKEDDMMEEDDTVATGSTYPSTAEHSVASSSLATQPMLPHGKLIDAPRAALYDWYLKEHKTQVVGKECYFTWHNDGLPHERMFTSIFVCPVTGELFPTGKYGPRTGTKKRIDSLTGETIEETKLYYGERKDPLTGANVVWFST